MFSNQCCIKLDCVDFDLVSMTHCDHNPQVNSGPQDIPYVDHKLHSNSGLVG